MVTEVIAATDHDFPPLAVTRSKSRSRAGRINQVIDAPARFQWQRDISARPVLKSIPRTGPLQIDARRVLRNEDPWHHDLFGRGLHDHVNLHRNPHALVSIPAGARNS